MRIYPAIDIKDGKCVRLLKGEFDKVTVYGDDPAQQALKWMQCGAEYIHVVDLDGALKGRGVNADAIKKICKSVDIPVQTGGGIRTMEDIEAKLGMGVARVIIGTKAVSDSDFIKRAADKYGDKIVVGIDAKDGFAAVEGWEKVSSLKAVDFAKQMESIGIQTIIYTDIATDGTLQGPNIAAMEEMAQSLGIDVIASGGIGNAEHVRQLKPTGVEGVIIGKALYTGAVTMKDGKIY